MTEAQPIQQYFLKKVLRFSGVGLIFLFVTSISIAFLLTRTQVASDLQESAIAVAQAFHDRILDGDIRSVEPQIRKILKIRSGESAQILKSDLSRVYNLNDFNEKIETCPRMNLTCFKGWFGQARILVPISMSNLGGPGERILYISKRAEINWEFWLTVFVVFVLGYISLFIAFYRVSKQASTELSAEILNWSNRLKFNPKKCGTNRIATLHRISTTEGGFDRVELTNCSI